MWKENEKPHCRQPHQLNRLQSALHRTMQTYRQRQAQLRMLRRNHQHHSHRRRFPSHRHPHGSSMRWSTWIWLVKSTWALNRITCRPLATNRQTKNTKPKLFLISSNQSRSEIIYVRLRIDRMNRFWRNSRAILSMYTTKTATTAAAQRTTTAQKKCGIVSIAHWKIRFGKSCVQLAIAFDRTVCQRELCQTIQIIFIRRARTMRYRRRVMLWTTSKWNYGERHRIIRTISMRWARNGVHWTAIFNRTL